jgi:hypothetical protein
MSDDSNRGEAEAVARALRRVRVSRRLVLGGLLASAPGLAAADSSTRVAASRRAVVMANDPRLRTRLPLLAQKSISVIRPRDLLVLDFAFVNLARAAGKQPRLTRIRAGVGARLIVGHAPQAIAESAYFKTDGQKVPTVDKKGEIPPPHPQGFIPISPDAAQALIAEPSRVAFEMPADVGFLDYSLQGLLQACRDWPLALDGAAIPPPAETQLLAFSGVSLQSASAVLAASLAQTRSPAFDKRVDVASRRVADAIAASPNAAEMDVDALVGRELSAAGLDTSRLTAGQTQAVFGLVEATALSRVTAERRPPLAVRPRPPHPPRDDVTAIELPYRLIQSPLPGAGFEHTAKAPPATGRTELWHTRLGKRRAAPADDQPRVDDRAVLPLRALWSPDYPAPIEPSGDWALSGLDRQMLVDLTANQVTAEKDGKPYTPRPTKAKRLMLSALGGWLDSEGQWSRRPFTADISGWKHQTAMARDHYVRVVYAGFLFPFGHAASLVKETQRKFFVQPNGDRVAVLIQRCFIIVRERTRTFPVPNQPHDGRAFPFTQVDIVTQVTPDLASPGKDGPPGKPTGSRLDDVNYPALTPSHFRQAFLPVLEGGLPITGDCLFQVIARDAAGRQIGFSTPLMFVSELRNNQVQLAPISAFYNKLDPARLRRPLGGQIVQFTQGPAQGDGAMPADSITLNSGLLTPHTVYAPAFHPTLKGAEVRLPAVESMLGKAGAQAVTYPQTYLDHGFDPPDAAETARKNPGEVFLTLVSPGPGSGSSEKLGGLMSPNLKPSALSRRFGAVGGAGGAAKFLGGQFDPADFIPADVKLLGVFPLRDILNVIDFASALSSEDATTLDKVPRLTNLDLLYKVEASFHIRQSDLKGVGEIFKPSDNAVLDITAKTVVWRDGVKAAETGINGSLTDFRINLFGCLIINFDKLAFAVSPGAKPDVTVNLDPENGVMFGGPLSFINQLKNYLPANGFSDPPGLSVTPAGITASYSLGLPPVSIGVMTLQNVSVGAAFNLPFDGRPPSARFNFAERHSPFCLTISAIGGGGFVALCVDTGGVQEVEAALEFGAQIAIDLGVASGSVYVKGGFYFHWKDQGATSLVELEAYVELGGHLSVLGIISVTLVFHLGLTYEKNGDTGRLYGQATLTVEIDILFFSVSVGVTVERQFAGSKDPLFIDLVKPDHWHDYCAAFAA